MGLVFKTPFNDDIDRQSYSYELFPETNETISRIAQFKEVIQMPMSNGLGVLYKLTDNFFVSGDIYRTNWNQFEYIKNDQEKVSILQIPLAQSQVKPATHIRFGIEYKLKYKSKDVWLPLRAGLFYDPVASDNNPDDMYGISLGFGITANELFSFDMAYQYRYGKNLFSYMVKGMDFSRKLDEHLIYLSLIIYYNSSLPN